MGQTLKRRMKTTFAVLTATVLAGSLFAGPETIVKQRAKELSNQNNVRQGVAAPVRPVTAPRSAVAAPPAASPALGRLRSSLAAFKAGQPATAAQKEQLARDLVAVAQGAKPSLATATKLAEELAGAFVEKPLSPSSRARLVMELDALLNPAKYPQAKPEGIYADVQAIFQANGLERRNAVTIADQVKALAGEVRGGG